MGWGEAPKPRQEHPKSGIRVTEEAIADHDALDQIADLCAGRRLVKWDDTEWADRIEAEVSKVRNIEDFM